MTTLVIGAGLIGSQVARILVERDEKPVLMDVSAQPASIGEIVDLAKVTLVAGDILRPLSIVDVLKSHNITRIAHTAANPLLTLGAQREPYAAINLNIMGTVNVLEAARVTGLKRVVVSSSSVLNHYLDGGEDDGDFGKEEACPRPPRSTRRPSRRSKAWPQLRQVVRHRVRGPALRRGVRTVERRRRRRTVEHRARGDEERARRPRGDGAAGRDGVGLLQGRRARHGDGARRQGPRQPRVQHHHGRADHARRAGRGDRRCHSRRQGEVRRAAERRRCADEPRQPRRSRPGQADARLRAAVQAAGGGEGPRGVDAAIYG